MCALDETVVVRIATTSDPCQRPKRRTLCMREIAHLWCVCVRKCNVSMCRLCRLIIRRSLSVGRGQPTTTYTYYRRDAARSVLSSSSFGALACLVIPRASYGYILMCTSERASVYAMVDIIIIVVECFRVSPIHRRDPRKAAAECHVVRIARIRKTTIICHKSIGPMKLWCRGVM